MINSIQLQIQEIQQLAGKFLYEGNYKPYTDIEEWREVQTTLSKGIEAVIRQEGSTPDEEAEAILAILMGYTIAVKNRKNIERALERAKQIWALINNPILKCKLAIFCYVENFDEFLAEEAHRLIGELKQSSNLEEMEWLEKFLNDIEESSKIIE